MSSEFGVQPVAETTLIRFGRHAFDLSANLLLEDDRVVPIAPKAGELLAVLLTERGKLLSKDELMERVWADSFVEESNLTHHIAALRKVLGEDGSWIETIPRRGYRFRVADNDETIEIIYSDKEKVTVVEYAEETTVPTLVRSRAAIVIGAAMLGLTIAAAGAWYAIERYQRKPQANTSTVALSVSGSIRSFDVSADGRFIAYAWSPDKQPPRIYVQVVGAAEPLKVTDSGNEYSPAWSPDGRTIAFIRRAEGRAGIFLIPALGGSDRKLCDLNSDMPVNLTWSPNGQWLAVSDASDARDKLRGLVLVDAATGQRKDLTRPPEDSYGDFKASFSNDSNMIAFSREINATSQIFVYDIARETELFIAQESTFAESFVWSPGDREVRYSAKRGAIAELFSVSLSGDKTPVKIANLGTQVTRIDSNDGGRTLFSAQSIRDMNIWRTVIGENGQLAEVKLISSPRLDEYPAYSNSGDRITFGSDRSGSDEVWISDSDGREPFQLTKFNGPVVVPGAWSPDDSKIGCHASHGQDQDIYAINSTTGNVTKLTFGGKHFVRSWSADGNWLYFAKVENNISTLKKVNVTSGQIIDVAGNDANYAAETFDGKFVYFMKFSEGGIWRVSTNGGHEELVADSTKFPGVAKATIIESKLGFYLSNDAGSPRMVQHFLDLSTGSMVDLSNQPMPSGFTFAVSPDGKIWLSSRTDHVATEIVQTSIR